MPLTLTSAKTLLDATVTATAQTDEGGSHSLVVDFIDSWIATTSTFTAWTNSGGLYGCNNWSPPTSDYDQGVSFTQTATDCEQNQTRNEQLREISEVTGDIRNNGSPVARTQVLYNQTSTRSATGTRVANVYGGQCTGNSSFQACVSPTTGDMCVYMWGENKTWDGGARWLTSGVDFRKPATGLFTTPDGGEKVIIEFTTTDSGMIWTFKTAHTGGIWGPSNGLKSWLQNVPYVWGQTAYNVPGMLSQCP